MDTRRDAGEFYPGGKVISTRPLASGGDVKHSDFEDLDVKTNTIPDLRQAVRELGRRLGATVVTALAVCVATAATVQTVPVNDLDFDANPSIVTNVVFDAPPDFSTNNTALVATIEATAPAPGNYAAVSNAAVYAAITNALQDAELESLSDSISTLNDTKASKADATLTERGPNQDGFSAWTVVCSDSSVHAFVEYISGGNYYRLLSVDDPLFLFDQTDPIYPNDTATSLAFSYEDAGFTFTATRTALPGYVLGSDTNHILAAQAQMDELSSSVAAVSSAATNYTNASISPTSPTFSNAVISVGLGIDTNTVAVINELVDSAHDLPVTGATSVGALLLALAAAIAALKKRLPYALVAKTIENGAVTLDDRASNAVEISAPLSPNTLSISFPAATSSKLRDFAMRLNIVAGVTAPEIAWPLGVTLENKGGEMPEIADGGADGSSTILYFSETENNGTTAKFLVKGETLTAIAH